mmetsp:Transcript_48601/g.155233  ORF Transcript_48601/g.155233 Transcript_48601/m.155233 type:complete len:267 (+) Transcript_48601:85-885(+)
MQNGERNKIFVGSLPPDCTTEDLQIVFSTYGNPQDIHLMSGKSNSGQCCAFVIYDSREAAESAIASLDGVYNMREDGTGPIRVSWARPSAAPPRPVAPMVQMAGHQPAVINPIQSPHSPVAASPIVPIKPGGGMPIGAGAGAALVAPAAQTLAARAYAAPGAGGVPPPPPPDPSMRQKTKLFVGNLPSDISQEAINIVFSHYGTVTNIHVMVGKAKSGQACAFVEYSSPVEAETAVLTLHEKYEIKPGDGAIIVKYASGGVRPGPY